MKEKKNITQFIEGWEWSVKLYDNSKPSNDCAVLVNNGETAKEMYDLICTNLKAKGYHAYRIGDGRSSEHKGGCILCKENFETNRRRYVHVFVWKGNDVAPASMFA